MQCWLLTLLTMTKQHLKSGKQGEDDYDDDKYIMIQCLFVTFLFIPALLPSPVQSCYDWMKHSIWQKNKLQDTKQIQKKINWQI